MTQFIVASPFVVPLKFDETIWIGLTRHLEIVEGQVLELEGSIERILVVERALETG